MVSQPSAPRAPIITKSPHRWYMDSTIFQVWPASFQDSNGDGIGDLRGIISRLDYIKSLGAKCIWLSPMYDSPQEDMGYDISDYNAIYPTYGNMDDMDELIKGCHDRGMRILCDLVVNHTSDQHKWFQESRSSKDNPKRDWYIWRPARYDADGKRHPPSNWRSCFSESAWEWDEKTQEYYLHLFVVGQPDLNWTNEECRKAILDSAVEFWLKKGVDGFRIDTASLYSKPMDFPDAPVVEPGVPHQPAFSLFCDGPRLEEHLRELGAMFSKYDAMTVGEFPNASYARSVQATSASDPQMSMNFHFGVCDFGRDVLGDTYKLIEPSKRKLSDLKKIITDLQQHIEGTDSWSTFFMENHDIARSISRYADDSPEWRTASGKLLACLNVTMSGTLFLYQGQEIGMINFPSDWPLKDFQDVGSINYLRLLESKGKDPEEGRAGLAALARDHARTPVQWTSGKNAGFSEGKPWMRVNDRDVGINAEDEDKDPKSVLNFYRKAIALRNEHVDILGGGLFRIDDPSNDQTMVYAKLGHDGRTAVVQLNFSTKDQKVGVPKEAEGKDLQFALGSYDEAKATDVLRPMEGRIFIAA